MKKSNQDLMSVTIDMAYRGMDDDPDAKPRASIAINYNYLDRAHLAHLEQFWVVNPLVGLVESDPNRAPVDDE